MQWPLKAFQQPSVTPAPRVFLCLIVSRWPIIAFQMSSSITPQQASGLRAAGYLAFLIGLLSAFGWMNVIRQDYVMEHQWPAASATVHSMREDSREVRPSSTRQRNFQVFWMEFLVVLDLPQGQCPSPMVPVTTQEPQCTGTVKTPEVESRADAVSWATRHPRDSKVIVHYDPQSERMTFGGESIFNIYPWTKITFTAVILIVAALMIKAGRRQSALSQYPQSVPEIKEE
jgi:hypothetical protein